LRSQNKPGFSSFLEMMSVKSTNNNPPPFKFIFTQESNLVQFCSFHLKIHLHLGSLFHLTPSKLAMSLNGAFFMEETPCVLKVILGFQWDLEVKLTATQQKTGHTPLQPELASNAATLPQTCA